MFEYHHNHHLYSITSTNTSTSNRPQQPTLSKKLRSTSSAWPRALRTSTSTSRTPISFDRMSDTNNSDLRQDCYGFDLRLDSQDDASRNDFEEKCIRSRLCLILVFDLLLASLPPTLFKSTHSTTTNNSTATSPINHLPSNRQRTTTTDYTLPLSTIPHTTSTSTQSFQHHH